MQRVGVELVARRQLHHAAQIHHRDAVGDVFDDVQIMRDEQVRQPHALLQIVREVDHLRLNRHIQRGDRLVADDELRLDGERAGNADALALAAGKLVGKRLACSRFSPTVASSSATRSCRRFASYMLWIIMPSSMIEPTVMRGSSDA